MKIDLGKPPEKSDAVKPRKTGNNEKTSAVARKAVADKVNLSGAAREIAEIMSSVKAIPDVRKDKVAEVKNQIDSGSYVTDAYKIAGKIIDEAT